MPAPDAIAKISNAVSPAFVCPLCAQNETARCGRAVNRSICSEESGRDAEIRTRDPLTPSQVRYQAALHPVRPTNSAQCVVLNAACETPLALASLGLRRFLLRLGGPGRALLRRRFLRRHRLAPDV